MSVHLYYSPSLLTVLLLLNELTLPIGIRLFQPTHKHIVAMRESKRLEVFVSKRMVHSVLSKAIICILHEDVRPEIGCLLFRSHLLPIEYDLVLLIPFLASSLRRKANYLTYLQFRKLLLLLCKDLYFSFPKATPNPACGCVSAVPFVSLLLPPL